MWFIKLHIIARCEILKNIEHRLIPVVVDKGNTALKFNLRFYEIKSSDYRVHCKRTKGSNDANHSIVDRLRFFIRFIYSLRLRFSQVNDLQSCRSPTE